MPCPNFLYVSSIFFLNAEFHVKISVYPLLKSYGTKICVLRFNLRIILSIVANLRQKVHRSKQKFIHLNLTEGVYDEYEEISPREFGHILRV